MNKRCKHDMLPEACNLCFQERLEESKSYLGYCYKEGAIDESELEGKSDKELIEMSDYLMGKADVMADNMVKGEI